MKKCWEFYGMEFWRIYCYHEVYKKCFGSFMVQNFIIWKETEFLSLWFLKTEFGS